MTYVHYTRKWPRQEHLTEWQFFGITKLSKDYGQVYMRPESFQDKVMEYFNPVEIDFDFDKAFSKKYYVLSNDEDKLRKKVTPSFLAAINKHEGLEIEIQERDMLVRLRKRVSTESAGILVELVNDLTKK